MADQPNEPQHAHDQQAPDQVQVSPTGAIMGNPGAEHGAYGMVREDTAAADALTERKIRGVEPAEPTPAPIPQP